MRLDNITPSKSRSRPRKRVGRGHGSGQGKTSGRGMKGQKARESLRPGFAGRVTPLYRRLPKKRGESNRAHNIGLFRREFAIVNVGDLARFTDDTVVTPELLRQERVISKIGDGVKILGEGELDRRLQVRAHAFSAGAKAKIEKAGGTAEVIG